MATTPLRFAIKLILGFALLMGAFEASRGSAIERFLVEDVILVPTTHLIDAATPQEHVILVGRTLTSPGSNLCVTRGCEGVEMFLMLAAGILAYPATWRQRARGLALGSLLAYVLSVSRLMALHYILRHSPAAWEALHGLVLPLGPIVLLALYFMLWSQRASPASAATPAPHAA